MSNKKQSSNHIPDVGNKVSSVEWLFQNMFEISQTLVTGNDTQYELMKKAYEQAKEMHKEEIQDAWNDGYFEIGGPEKYYNQTYNNDAKK
jgi:hypothetical protein